MDAKFYFSCHPLDHFLLPFVIINYSIMSLVFYRNPSGLPTDSNYLMTPRHIQIMRPLIVVDNSEIDKS